MKVTGFTFICNAVKNDYPIIEAIQSILPVCDEFVVAVGKSEDETLSLIKNINSPKIRIIETVWDNSLREGGKTFAIETDKAYAAISDDTDWAFYIQGDECVHEKYLSVIKKAMEDNLDDKKVEGLLFKYLHFYCEECTLMTNNILNFIGVIFVVPFPFFYHILSEFVLSWSWLKYEIKSFTSIYSSKGILFFVIHFV